MTFVRRYAAPLAAFVIGVAASVVAAFLTAQAEQGRRQARFEGLASGAVAAIESRMLSQLTLLRGTAGFFLASERVERSDFRAYVARLGLAENYPGVLGIGYAASADRAGLARLAAAAEADGGPAITPWPSGERPDYSAILFIEPMDRRNREALGYDMLSEDIRRSAMEAARSSGRSRMSGKVRLVQEIDPVKQAGVLIYTPLSRNGRPFGWVYSPLRADDLFSAIFAGRDLSELVVEVYDERPAAERLLYRSAVLRPGADQVLLRPIQIAGRTWLVRLSSSASFDETSPLLFGAGVGAVGVLISLLLAALMLQQARANMTTEREVLLRTTQLREALARLRDEAEAREQAEAQVRQMQKMEAIGQLTGGIAHDFNNMLAVIVGNLDMAERRSDDPSRLRRAIGNARQGAEKAAELTRRLLAFGRRQALSPRVLDVNALVAGMSELLRRSLGETVQLETRLADAPWRVHADPAQLENAILNLAINGRDAMPDGGTLLVSTANCSIDESSERHRQDRLGVGDFVLIAVRDHGSGMSDEVAARAIEPFFTTKEVGRGTGLGLSQVYGFVKQSGGHLRIRSIPGAGTTIEIYLPRTHHEKDVAAAAAEAVVERDLPTARAGEIVLVAEDEDQVREMAVETLAELGYRVLSAANGAEALTLLEKRPDVRLLFTDVVMPQMDGRRLADQALQLRPELRLLFTTGYTPDRSVHDGTLYEGIRLLQKPYNARDLAREVRRALDRR